jgi:hypothetical protein
MIRVTVLVQGRLAARASASSDGEAVDMPEGSRVRDLVPILGLLEEEVKRVAVNGCRARLDSSLRREDFVEFE